MQGYKDASGAYMRKPVSIIRHRRNSIPSARHRHNSIPSASYSLQDYDNASAVLSKAAKLMADTDGRAACDLFIAAMDIMKVDLAPSAPPQIILNCLLLGLRPLAHDGRYVEKHSQPHDAPGEHTPLPAAFGTRLNHKP